MQWTVKKRNDFSKILDKLGYIIGAEVGVWQAEYAIVLLNNNSTIKTLHLIDPWTAVGMTRTTTTGDEAFNKAIDNLESYKGRYVIHKGLSKDIHDEFEDRTLDFLYLDASHDYDNVKQDLNWWVPKVKKGGLFFGHDYNNRGYKKVKKAVDEYFGEENVNKTQEKVASWFVGIY